MKTKKLTLYGLMIALAFLLSYLDSLIPYPVPVPGIKIGLANLVVITALYEMGEKDAVILSVVRIVLVGFTFTNVSMMMYSLAGGILSAATMILLKKTGAFSMVGVSVAGGIAHNIGQILVAIVILGTANMILYLPVLLFSGILAGIAIGLAGAELTKRVHRVFRNQ